LWAARNCPSWILLVRSNRCVWTLTTCSSFFCVFLFFSCSSLEIWLFRFFSSLKRSMLAWLIGDPVLHVSGLWPEFSLILGCVHWIMIAFQRFFTLYNRHCHWSSHRLFIEAHIGWNSWTIENSYCFLTFSRLSWLTNILSWVFHHHHCAF
jgi:hypothetical protein